MEFFVIVAALNPHTAQIVRLHLFRLGEFFLEPHRTITRAQAIRCLKNHWKFLVASVYQNMFIRIAPVQLVCVQGQEYRRMDDLPVPEDDLGRLPPAWEGHFNLDC